MSDDSNVVTVGEFQIRRVRAYERDQKRACTHSHLELDDQGEIVRCTDCGVQVSAFWALSTLAADINHAFHQVEQAHEKLAWERAQQTRRRATLEVDEAWRSRTMLPSCPFCHKGILPTDGFGRTRVNKEIEMERRAAEHAALLATAAGEREEP